jgi:aspartokinase
MLKIKKLGHEVTTNPQLVLNILKEHYETVAVVSAVSGATDLLISFLESKIKKEELIDRIIIMHTNYEKEGIKVSRHIANLIEEISKDKLNNEKILAEGERIIANMIKEYLKINNINCYILYPESINLYAKIRHNNIVISKKNLELMKEKVLDLNVTDAIYIIPGFYLTEENSTNPITLGRGGSDFTAAILHKYVPSILYFYKSVSQIYSVDPLLGIQSYTQYIPLWQIKIFSYYTGKLFYPLTFYLINDNNIKILSPNGEEILKIDDNSKVIMLYFGHTNMLSYKEDYNEIEIVRNNINNINCLCLFVKPNKEFIKIFINISYHLSFNNINNKLNIKKDSIFIQFSKEVDKATIESVKKEIWQSKLIEIIKS